MPSPLYHRLTTLGALSVDQFMRQYWQREPVCIRGALAPDCAPLTPTQLFALARQEDVESRLIRHTPRGWQLQHGPFARLPSRQTPNWTLLVQGVDLHDDVAHAFLQQFRFIADARLDDLMISYATDGGGVGAHIDAYDVFLIQGHGRRRWRIAPPGDATAVPDVPLKLLAHFAPTQTWVLEPGDCLYLPPGWGHEGVAQGPCMTLSVGFRAPSRHEFLAAWLHASAEQLKGPDPRIQTRQRSIANHPAAMPAELNQQLTRWAQAWQPRASELQTFIGQYLTEPKPNVWFEQPTEPLNPTELATRAYQGGLRLARASRLLWHANTVFINGESCRASAQALPWLQQLANQRGLSPRECLQAFRYAKLRSQLHTWYTYGWLELGAPTRCGNNAASTD